MSERKDLTLRECAAIFNKHNHLGRYDWFWSSTQSHIVQSPGLIHQDWVIRTEIEAKLMAQYYLAQEQQGETKPKWKSEPCESRVAFQRGRYIDLTKSSPEFTAKYFIQCAATKGHKTQHWATIEGERVNWE